MLQRTTRRLDLTPEGMSYYESCRRILREIAAIEADFQSSSAQLRERLRVHMPAAIGRAVVLPTMQQFQSRHPEVDLMISLGDRLVDLIQAEFTRFSAS